MAEDLEMKVQTFSSYYTGTRIPPETVAEKMAAYFFGNDTTERRRLISALTNVRAQSRKTNSTRRSAPEFLEHLASGHPLSWSCFNAEPFIGDKDTFFHKLFVERFFRLSGLNPEFREPPGSQVHRLLWDRDIDLWLGCFARVDRSVLAHFWTTPIRVSLGAIIHSKHELHKPWIKDVLARKAIKHQPKGPRLRPIVVRGEAGDIYCRDILEFHDTELDSDLPFHPGQIATRLRRLSSGSDIPVVVIDEYTSFKILQELGNEGIPVIPLSTRAAITADECRRELPQYFLSLACSRDHKELRDVLDQSLWLFLSTELETTATALLELYHDVVEDVQDVAQYFIERPDPPHADEKYNALSFQYARKWALYSLGIDAASIKEYPRSGLPWVPILERARRAVQRDLATPQREHVLRSQIQFHADYTDNPLSDEQFKDLARTLDIPEFMLTDAQRQYVLQDPEFLLQTLQHALRGEDIPQLTPRMKLIDPRQDKSQLDLIYGFLAEIMKLYNRELGDRNKAAPIIQRLLEGFPHSLTDFPNVVMAYHGERHPHYIGCTLLYPNGSELELRYMFVLERFRKLSVGEHIISYVHEHARVNHYGVITVHVLRQYLDGWLYFRKRGFMEVRQEEDRIVLSYPTTKTFPN